MLFGKLLELQNNDMNDNQLEVLEKELKQTIETAKTLAQSCKIKYNQEHQFKLDSSGELVYPTYNPNINYNEEFWKKYLKNQINFAIIKDLSEKINRLTTQVKDVESLNQQYHKIFKLLNRKKNRRLAVEIQKSFNCPYDKCYRIYGSDVSLNLHIKLKHKGGNKTDREKLAEEICVAELAGLPKPSMTLNLPTGFLEEYRKKFLQKQRQGKQNWITSHLQKD